MRMPHADDPLPNHAGESWRTWLMTGARRGRIDRRRVRGAHVGIKRMLVEGMRIHGDQPYTWKEFSDAMVRQAVGEAMGVIGRGDAELVKLAYFGGMTNGDIARHTGLNESMVQRRLRVAIDAISRHVQRGRRLGARVVAGVFVWLTGRWANDAVHAALQGVAVATAAAVIAAHPAVVPSVHRPGAAPGAGAPAAVPVDPPAPSPTAPASAPGSAAAGAPAVPAVGRSAPQVQVPALELPVAVPSPPSTQTVTSTVKHLL